MSKEGDKAAVFKTTKVRTKLKDDGSWLQRPSEPQEKTTEEKPWLAEVRARRINGTPVDTSPVSSPTKTTLPSTKPDPERAPTSGYLIRGVLTKPDKSPSSSTSNGFIGTTQFNKKPSESYKKIAPHTVRSTSENQEGQLSAEEQEKRTEAASNVLKKSSARQRSYVLSAAKKFESKQEAPDTPLTNSTQSFMAKRVEVTDDDESAVTPAPASTPPPSAAVPVTSAASGPQPKPRKIVDTSGKTAVDVPVNEPVAPRVEEKEEAAPEPVKEDPLPVSVTEKDPFEHMKPGCTKVDTPLPELLPELIQAVSTQPEPEHSDVSEKPETPVKELAPVVPTPMSPTPAPSAPESPPPVPPTPASPDPVSAAPESPPPVPPTPAFPVLASAAPESPPLVSLTPASPVPMSPVPLSPDQVSAVVEITVKTEPEPEPEPEQSPEPSSSVDTLTTLSDTLISFDTTSTSFKDDEPVLAEEEGSSGESHTTENSAEQEPAPELSNCIPMTDDLLALTEGPEASAEPVPPSPGSWSQDLLGGLDSESNPAKTSGTLDLLANDVIPINTETPSLSMQQEEEKQTDETAKEAQSVSPLSSSTETITVTTKTVIITDKSEEDNVDPWSSRATTTVTEPSSADPFDPYPIGTTSPNSSSDLLQPLSDISINSPPPTSTEDNDSHPEANMSGNALESLADDIIPIDTDTTSLSTQRSWETSKPEQTEESQDAVPEGPAADEKMLVMFERKSTENDSPWDRWTSPTLYTITTTAGEEEEEEEEEESPEDTQTQTVTTITTFREIHSEPEPVMDRYETYSRAATVEEDQRVPSPDPEAKKGFVYVKEYVNTTEMSLHNAKDGDDGGLSYLTSSSPSYAYSSQSTYSSGSLSSTCTYCGELVGNDAKISIEHLSINCHPACFKCDECGKPMGDLLDGMFLHGGKVNCESCYARAFD